MAWSASQLPATRWCAIRPRWPPWRAERMTGSRPGRIWGLVAGQAASRGARVSAGDACAAAVVTVDVTGAWLNAGRGAEAGHLMHATNEVSEQLAELEVTLGEGPGRDASTSGGPVLAS